MAWITADDLRTAAGAKQPGDQLRIEEAVEIACAEVERLCGPIPWVAVTDEFAEVAGSDRACLKYRPMAQGASAALVAVTTVDGVALTLSDFRVDGQVLARRDGAAISTDLLVSYRTGYYDDTPDGATAPVWARSMAKLIGHQYLRVTRRNQIDASAAGDLTQTHFLTPAAALDIGRDHLLWLGGAG